MKERRLLMGKHKIDFIIGEHPEVENRIVVAFDNTGIDLNNIEHKDFMTALSQVMAKEMFCKSNHIAPDFVERKEATNG